MPNFLLYDQQGPVVTLTMNEPIDRGGAFHPVVLGQIANNPFDVGGIVWRRASLGVADENFFDFVRR